MKEGTAKHRKMKRLGRLLANELEVDANLGRHLAVSIMERFWHWATRYARDGAINGAPDYADDIAEEVEAPAGLAPEDLIELLITADWVDVDVERLLIHDWPEHCQDSVHRALARGKAFFADGSAPRLTRLTKDERAEAMAFYRGTAESGRTTGAQSAPNVRTACAQTDDLGAQRAPTTPGLGAQKGSLGALPSQAKPSQAKPCQAGGVGGLAPQGEEQGPNGAESPPERASPKISADLVRRVWDRGKRALERYGHPSAEELTEKRRRRIRAILREAPVPDGDRETVLAQAAHGYVARCGLQGHDGYDPLQGFKIGQIMSPERFQANYDAAQDARARGKSPPFAKGDNVGRPRKRVPVRRVSAPAAGGVIEDLVERMGGGA